MLVVVPELLTMLDGTTVPENDAPAWDKAKAYKAGDKVVQKHYVYQAIKDNTNVEPYVSHIGSSGTWQPVGTTNLYKCLDWYSHTQTVAPEGATEMTFVVPWVWGSTACALFNMSATSADITITSTADNTTLFAEQYDLLGGCSDWWEYFFGEQAYRKNLTVRNIPPVGGTLTVTLRGVRPALGMIIVGRQYAFFKGVAHEAYGKTLYGARTALEGYSTQEIDQDLGTVTSTPRYNGGRIQASIVVHPEDVNYVTGVLNKAKIVPCLWLCDNGTDCDPLNVFGFLSTDDGVFEGPCSNQYSFTIKGIA